MLLPIMVSSNNDFLFIYFFCFKVEKKWGRKWDGRKEKKNKEIGLLFVYDYGEIEEESILMILNIKFIFKNKTNWCVKRFGGCN